MKKYLLIFTISVFQFVACSENKASKSSDKSGSEEMSYPMESVMINKTQCKLYGDFKDLKIEDVVGVWKDSLFWKMNRNNSKNKCYYGIDELDKSVELELKEDKTYRLSTKFSRPQYNSIEVGEYFLYYDSTVTTLLLAKNPEGQSQFEQGDTMVGVYHNFLWVDNNTIILDQESRHKNYRWREGIEFNRVQN